VRIAALLLAVLAVGASTASGGAPAASCPRDASLGSIRFERGGRVHVVSLATCADRVTGRAPAPRAMPDLPSADGRYVATVRVTGRGRSERQTIWVRDRRTGRSHPVLSEPTFGRQRGSVYSAPGPIGLLAWSGDDRWIFYFVDPGNSASIAADGLPMRVVARAGGRPHVFPVSLNYDDYRAWCGGRLVFTAGFDRVATNRKRLLVAAPPAWRTRALWPDRGESFGSVACAPDARSVAVLAQRSSGDPEFFSTRWQLWRVGFDGTRTLLDAPPAGSADESPQWSHDGRSLLFVRERAGRGRVMLLQDGTLYGPLANLGYSLGYYGHHAWGVRWTAA
jgi:dipeptidyl aminopeptidase/acylaminoacyl peptidase